MTVLFILFSIIEVSNSYLIREAEPYYSEDLVNCITNIVTKYIAPRKELTYVGNKQEDEELLKTIHDLNLVKVMSRRYTQKVPILHHSYFISNKNCAAFTRRFPDLTKETTWNPKAYFFIVIRELDTYSDLLCIFDVLLKWHVVDVVVINGTSDAHMYSYSPFDNNNCGRYYDDVISYGKCSQMHDRNIFPYKYLTGLHNCTLNVVIPNWPPYTLFPSNYKGNSLLFYGTEPYLLKLVGELENFTMNIIMENGTEIYPTITSDMEADGPLRQLQINEADVILGGLMLTPSRAVAFEYVHDLFPYVDEVRFVLKRAEFVAAWKIFYIEFDGMVWALILISLTSYSIIMSILLRVEDKSLVVLQLLNNLVLHGCNIACHSTVKFVFILWLWFAYLINSFYQSSLVSLTTNPAVEHQISTEQEIMEHKLRPCFSDIMEKFYRESIQSVELKDFVSECDGQQNDVLQLVKESQEYYSLALTGIYEYNIDKFYDDNGHSQLYLLKIPYSKVIYCMYFYKGFPFMHEIRESALRLREMGLVEKAMSDMSYLQKIKHRFHGNKYEFPFVTPWSIYIFGSILATITFIVEILSNTR